MGDMAGLYSDMREDRRFRQAERLSDFKAMENDFIALGLVERTPYHWTIEINGQTCQYWPSSCKWHYDRTYIGDAKHFYNWLRRRTLMDNADVG